MARTGRSLRLLIALIVTLIVALPACADILWSDMGFFVDMPEGFYLANGDGKTRFAFLSPDDGMEFDIISYDPGRYASAQALATDALKKIGSTGEMESFEYQGRSCIFAELVFTIGGAPKKGYAVFIAGRATPATPATPAIPERSIALLAYTNSGDFEAYADFILSCLDCFSVDKAALRMPGPVSQYLLPWPAAHEATKTVAFGDARIELPWSDLEAEQEQGTAGREFRVLQAYGTEGDLWKAAWARTYRMIYRESAARLDRLAIELDRYLPEDPTDAARQLLFWSQGWSYERDQEGIDFVDPLTAAYEGRGDCDSRAMVLSIILERRGIDSILMVSATYSHALLAVDVPGGGQRFAFGGKKYLVAETTAKVGLGMIAQDQADWSKWLGVQLGD